MTELAIVLDTEIRGSQEIKKVGMGNRNLDPWNVFFKFMKRKKKTTTDSNNKRQLQQQQ